MQLSQGQLVQHSRSFMLEASMLSTYSDLALLQPPKTQICYFFASVQNKPFHIPPISYRSVTQDRINQCYEGCHFVTQMDLLPTSLSCLKRHLLATPSFLKTNMLLLNGPLVSHSRLSMLEASRPSTHSQSAPFQRPGEKNTYICCFKYKQRLFTYLQ